MNLFDQLIDEALNRSKITNIYTLALYHDHESAMVSVRIDTEENSIKKVHESNKYSMRNLQRLIGESNLKEALLWQANVGRNLSLGDFTEVNVSEREIEMKVTDSFYLSMITALNNKAASIMERSTHSESLLFCCSTEQDEVGLVWVPWV